MSLCDKRTNQATAREFVQNLRHIATAVCENLLRRIFIGAREDGGKGRVNVSGEWRLWECRAPALGVHTPEGHLSARRCSKMLAR